MIAILEWKTPYTKDHWNTVRMSRFDSAFQKTLIKYYNKHGIETRLPS